MMSAAFIVLVIIVSLLAGYVFGFHVCGEVEKRVQKSSVQQKQLIQRQKKSYEKKAAKF